MHQLLYISSPQSPDHWSTDLAFCSFDACSSSQSSISSHFCFHKVKQVNNPASFVQSSVGPSIWNGTADCVLVLCFCWDIIKLSSNLMGYSGFSFKDITLSLGQIVDTYPLFNVMVLHLSKIVTRGCYNICFMAIFSSPISKFWVKMSDFGGLFLNNVQYWNMLLH